MSEQSAILTEWKVLEGLFNTLYPQPNQENEPEWQGPGTLREPLFHAWEVRRRSFYRKMEAEAYLDAALMLVPEGWAYEARQGPSGQPHIWDLLTIKCGDVRYSRTSGRGRTPALALAAAIAKTMESE